MIRRPPRSTLFPSTTLSRSRTHKEGERCFLREKRQEKKQGREQRHSKGAGRALVPRRPPRQPGAQDEQRRQQIDPRPHGSYGPCRDRVHGEEGGDAERGPP